MQCQERPRCQRLSLLVWSPSVTPSIAAVPRHRQAHRYKNIENNQKCVEKKDLTSMVRTMKLTAWKMNKPVPLSKMRHDNCEKLRNQRLLNISSCSDGWASRAGGKTTRPTRRRRGAAPLELASACQRTVSLGQPTTKTENNWEIPAIYM